MKISQTEHNIKKKLDQREITPSQNLWENIEQELDKKSQPKNNKIWLKYASIAAVLCLGFLVYQGLKPMKNNPTQMVLDSKPIIKNQIIFNDTEFGYVAQPTQSKEKTTIKSTPKKVEIDNQVSNVILKEEKSPIDDEVDNLLSTAQNDLAKAEEEKKLLIEVNTLLAEAIQETKDENQKHILKDMKATVLLAEIEAEIKLQKPQNLKDKIWEALVTNLNDIKRVVALN